MADERFLAKYRVRRGGEFQRAYRRRCTVSDERLLVFGHDNGLPHPRIGLSVSRKVGGAVVRQRWKRLLREAFRLHRTELPDGIDLIVIPRVDSPPTLAEVAQSLVQLACRLPGRLARTSQPGGRRPASPRPPSGKASRGKPGPNSQGSERGSQGGASS